MDIMTSLFDQDHITYLYGLEKKKEGLKEGIIQNFIDSIQHLTKKLHITREEAMELLEIPTEQKDIILKRLNGNDG